MGLWQSPKIPPLRGNETLEELREAYNRMANTNAMVYKDLDYLLNGFLDTLNIRELTADKIITGTLLANLVTIKSALAAGAELTLDGHGIKLTYPSGMTITLRETGFIAAYPSGVTVKINEGGFAIMKGGQVVFTVDNEGNGDYKGDVSVGASINVDNDVYIGDTLYINPISFGAGIRWVAAGGNIDIYIDPAGKALNLTAPNGVKLNGVNVVSSISSLEARVAALEARPIYVPPPAT
ncbi:hypothetical protein [Gorillibacterium sp. sgz5001074]|uniref:hypothetical protein n=1 Tax=Gorillibacterium sp. sgz5001074 TaxID=3446695 RepID=UPI003F66F159